MEVRTLIVDGVSYNCPVLEKMGKDAFVSRFKSVAVKRGKTEDEATEYYGSIFLKAVPDYEEVPATTVKKSKKTGTTETATDAEA